MVPPAIVLQASQARVPAVLAVHHMMRLTRGRRLVTTTRELAPLVPQGHQPPQMDRDVVGLALVCVLYLLLVRWTLRIGRVRDRGSGRAGSTSDSRPVGKLPQIPLGAARLK